MCVRSLPPVLVIHLKRFNYDVEENRTLKFNDFLQVRTFPSFAAALCYWCSFQFPMVLDMFPYTATGLSKLENDQDFFSSPLPASVDGSSLGSSLTSAQLLSASPGG